MLEFENTIRINRPVAEVFAFLVDLENLPKWNYYVLEVRKRSDGPIQIGTTYHQVRKTDEQDLRITELEPNHRLTVQTVPPSSPRLEMRFRLDAEADTTLLRDAWKLDTGVPALSERLGARRIKSAVAENLTKLKELLEVGRVVLQDGRQATRQWLRNWLRRFLVAFPNAMKDVALCQPDISHNIGRDNRNLPKMGGFSWPITDCVSPNMPLACSLTLVYTPKRLLGLFLAGGQ